MTTQQRSIQVSPTPNQRPIERFLALPQVAHAKPFSRGWRMCCPVHEDREESMQFWEDEVDGHVGIQCFVGCQRSDICEALGITESSLYVGARPPKPSDSSTRKLDLLDLALHKCIHPGVLISVQMRDGYTWHHPEGRAVRGVVRIPYFLEDGSPYLRSRIRTAVTAKSGSYWEGAEAPLIPYGLWKLSEAREQKVLWIVEGESDCWTHWYHRIPTLGIPGATNTAILEAAHLREIETLYIVQEPTEEGKQQDAGKAFVDGLCKRLRAIGYQGGVYVVSLKRTHHVKDPNELHQRLFHEGRLRDYATELEKAIHEAIPLDLGAAAPPPEELSEVQPLVEAAVRAQDTTALYELAPRIAGLPTKAQAILLTAIKQGMKQATGFSQRAFNKLVKEAVAVQQQVSAGHVRVTNKPDVLLSGDLEQDADAALAALYSANLPPVIFVRLGKLARCRTNEEGKPFIEFIDEAILLYELTRAANFLAYNQTRATYLPTYPPAAIARHILSRPRWNFPPLKGITEVPVIRSDGSVLAIPGYDAQSRLLYLPHPDLVIPPIPQNPTHQEVEAARDHAWSYLAEFPYETHSDAANAFALLLTTVTRSLYGPTPLAVIDATKQGSGKGLLSKVVAYVAQGRSVASMVAPGDENEWRKTLTAQLLEGNLLISLDNVEGLLYSATLASFLTSDTWNARLLGTMQSPELPQRVMMMANGNNILLGGDIPRRAYRIRMDAGISKPWMRTGFTYNPLLKYVRADRGKIIAALLTMVRAWYVAGKPAPQKVTPALAEFSAWAEVVGGILAYAGVDGFLDNLTQLYDEVDVEAPQWTNFLEMWVTTLGTAQYTTGQLIEHLQKEPTFAATLPDPLAGQPLGDAKEIKAFSIKLGRALQKRKGAAYGPDNTRLDRAEDKHSKQKVWSVSSHPVTETKPTRLHWGEQQEEQTAPVPHCLGESTRAEVSSSLAEAPSSLSEQPIPNEEDQQDVSAVGSQPLVCAVSGCGRQPEEDNGFVYDAYGYGWCGQHTSRKQLLEGAGQLKTPFPILFYARASQMLEEGQHAWETFVSTAPEEAIQQVREALGRREAQEHTWQEEDGAT